MLANRQLPVKEEDCAICKGGVVTAGYWAIAGLTSVSPSAPAVIKAVSEGLDKVLLGIELSEEFLPSGVKAGNAPTVPDRLKPDI
jgi:hypothetical protein